MVLASLLLATVLAVTPTPVPPPTPAPSLDALKIFRNAVTRLSSYPDPPYIVWTDIWQTQTTRLSNGEVTLTKEARRFAVRSSDGMEYGSDPPADKKLPPALILHVFVGPNAWSMHAPRPAPQAQSTPQSSQPIPDLAGLKTIATVTAVAPPAYRSEAPQLETLEGHQVYHLRVTPTSDPARHNLRELWVDTTTFDLRKARFTGTYAPFPGAPASPSDVTVVFTAVGPYWLVIRQTWTYVSLSSGARFKFDAMTTRFALPQTLPDWLFNESEYNKHQRAGEGDVLDPVLEGQAAPE
jgi:hypothetical protein